MNKYLFASFVLVSTVIGIGIFALPYAFLQSGYWFFFWLVFWIFGFSFLNYLYAHLLSKAKRIENFPGLLAEFLHPKLRGFGWFLDLFVQGTVLWIYFLVAGEFLPVILPTLSFLQAKIIFASLTFLIGTLALLKFARFESLLSILMLVLTVILSFYFWHGSNLLEVNFAQKPLFAYGSIVFAYAGISSVPIMYDLVKKRKKILQISLVSYLVIGLVYLFFALSMVSFFGGKIEDLSLRSLIQALPQNWLAILILLVLFNILTTAVSIIFYLKRGLQNEFQFQNWQATILLLLLIVILVALPKFKFISLVNLLGELLLGLEFLFLLFMAYKTLASRLGKTLILIFSLLIVFALVHVF